MEVLINQPYTSVVSGTGTIGAFVVINGSVVAVTSSTQVDTTTWLVTFTPTSSGVATVVAFGQVQERVLVVQKLSRTMLANVEDEALGSWQWNKQTGTLTLLRQDGSTLANFVALDSVAQASREIS